MSGFTATPYVGAVLALWPRTAPPECQPPAAVLELALMANSQRGALSITREDSILMETLQTHATQAAELLQRLWGFTSSCPHPLPRVMYIARMPLAGCREARLFCPTRGCRAEIHPGPRWSLVWPPVAEEVGGPGPPLHWRAAGGNWSLLRCFRNPQGRLCGAMYGPQIEESVSAQASSPFVLALRADFPRLTEPDASALLRAYRCRSPADCAGIGGHRCTLREHIVFPPELAPLLPLMGVTTDLFCSALSRGDIAPSITRWFSARVEDKLVGAAGDALQDCFSWAGMQAVLFPPLGYEALPLVAEKVASALAERPLDTHFTYFGPWPLSSALQTCLASKGHRATLLGSHDRPRLALPDSLLAAGPPQDVEACGVWLLHARGAPPPAPWSSMVALVSTWHGCQVGETLLRCQAAAHQQAASAAARVETKRRSSAMSHIYKLMEAAESCPAAQTYEKRSLEGRLVSLLRVEMQTRPAGASRDDLFEIPYDLQDYFQYLRYPTRGEGRSSYKYYHPCQFQSDDSERQWISFFGMCKPPFWTHHTQPSSCLLARHTGERAWMVLAHRPGELIAEIREVTRPTPGARHSVFGPPWQPGDELTVLLRCPVPSKMDTCVLYDVGASDFALHLLGAAGVQPLQPKGETAETRNRATFRLVPWEAVLRLYVPPVELSGPSSRPGDISEALLGKIKWSSALELSGDDCPEEAGKTRLPNSVHIPVDSGLPAVSECVFPAQVIKRRLQAPINTPAARERLREGLLVASPGSASSRAALITASEAIAPRPAGGAPAAYRQRPRKAATQNPHSSEVGQRSALVRALAAPGPLPARVMDTLESLRATQRILGSGEAPLPVSPPAEWTTEERRRVLARAVLSLRRERFQSDLWQATQADSAREKRRKSAREMWCKQRSRAFQTMTRAPPRPSVTRMEDLAQAVREQGRFVPLPPATQGSLPLYSPSPTEQWASEDILTDWKGAIAVGAPGDPDPIPVLSPLPPPGDFATGWRTSLTLADFQLWLESATAPLPAPLAGPPPSLPERAVDYETLEETIRGSFNSAWASKEGRWTGRNAYRWSIRDPAVLSALRLDDLHFAGDAPRSIVVTDGSGTGNAPDERMISKGGFAALVISAQEVTIVLGYSPSTTSGQMELAAVLEGLAAAMSATPTPASCASFSDYESWIKADLELYRASSAAKLRYPHLWITLIDVLATWGSDHPARHHLYRHHTKSHVDQDGDWAQNLNQLCDALARLAKLLLAELDGGQHVWHCPPSTTPWSPTEVRRLLSGPFSSGEWRHALRTRTSNAYDTDGSYYGLLRAGGTVLKDRMLDEFNRAAFRGQVPTYTPDGTVLNKHRAIGKSSGGDRHLGAPDSAMGIFASILSSRLIRATLHMRSVNRAQKCNIPRISGCQENRHLFLASLYDLMRGAREGLYVPGKVRLFFLNDLSKAFDRAQHTVILWALQILLGEACSTRFLAILDHMHKTARMVVTQQGVSVIISKEAGVIQGNPNSPPTFGCVMELVRRLIPPDQRPKIRFLCSRDKLELRIEVDYADDQQRATDSVEDMRICIGGLLHALRLASLQWNSSKLQILALRVEAGGSISCFDPELSVPDEAGGSIPIRAIKEGELLTLYGVDVDGYGRRNLDAATLREMEVCQRVRRSHFPVPAKLAALRFVNSAKGEFAFYSAWMSPDILQTLDKLERRTMRSFVSLNLPNAYIMGELHLSRRVWRQDVIFLAGFIRILGSKDPRVQLTALMMSRDAPQPDSYGSGDAPLSPRFFNWCGTFPEGYSGPPLTGHLLDTPERLCYLAATHGVGIWEENGRIHITHDGKDVLHPHRLLQTLSKARDRHFLRLLEARQSTDSRKERAPEFSLSWGTAGRPMPAQQRKEEMAFLNSYSSYTDAEIRMLLSLRLLLWPTEFRSHIRSGRAINTPPNCPCGMNAQTETHLLNIRPENTYHCEALRWLPQHRHTSGVECLVKALARSGWGIIQAEGHRREPDEILDGFRQRIRSAVNRHLLHLPAGSVSQHYRPDILLLHPVTGAVYIVDVTFGSDDKLAGEQRLGELFELRWPPRSPGTAAATRMYASASQAEDAIQNGSASTMAHFISESFDDDGALSDIKLEAALEAVESVGDPPSLVGPPTQPRLSISRVTSFARARYAHRYTPLAAVLAERPGRRAVHLLVIAVGVAGSIPRFTEQNIKLLFDKEAEAKKARQDLRHCAWRAAVECYRKWRTERA